DHAAATHAAKLTTAEAQIDWSLPAEQVSAHIRGMSPQPGAWTLLDGARTKILGIEAAPEHAPLPPGRIEAGKRQVLVATGTAPIALSTLAPAGKKPMRAADCARGASLAADARFTIAPQDGDPACPRTDEAARAAGRAVTVAPGATTA